MEPDAVKGIDRSRVDNLRYQTGFLREKSCGILMTPSDHIKIYLLLSVHSFDMPSVMKRIVQHLLCETES